MSMAWRTRAVAACTGAVEVCGFAKIRRMVCPVLSGILFGFSAVAAAEVPGTHSPESVNVQPTPHALPGIIVLLHLPLDAADF